MNFKKKMQQRLWIAGSYLILGAVLVITDAVTHFENYFFSSFGFALLAMGTVRMIHHREVMRDDQTLRKQELTESDERIRMISERAKSWVFSLTVTGAGILVIILNILGHHDAALPFAWFVCGMCVLYWICFAIIRKKY